MIRRFNYTNRKRIPRRNIHIVIASEPKRELREVSWDLADSGFPPEAAVYLEASSSGSASVIRGLPIGAAFGRHSLPTERSLDELSGANIFFDLKVVDETGTRGASSAWRTRCVPSTRRFARRCLTEIPAAREPGRSSGR